MAVPEDDTDLGRRQTLLGQLEDLLLDVVGGQLQPGGDCAAERQSRLGNTLARCVHATHGGRFVILQQELKEIIEIIEIIGKKSNNIPLEFIWSLDLGPNQGTGALEH